MSRVEGDRSKIRTPTLFESKTVSITRDVLWIARGRWRHANPLSKHGLHLQLHPLSAE
jgi:hypothetical protein